jgi:hypothetical protein
MMEATRTSETPVDNYFTRLYIPEDNSELYTRRRENLKSHNVCHILLGYTTDRFTTDFLIQIQYLGQLLVSFIRPIYEPHSKLNNNGTYYIQKFTNLKIPLL